MCPRITSRTASGSKRTTPSDAAVHHASAASPGPADSASSSAGDDTSRSYTTVGMSRAASGPAAAGDGGSGARYAPAPAAPTSNGRFSRYCSAMTAFSCSVYPGSSITSSRGRTGSGTAPGSVAVTIHTTLDRSNGSWR